MSTYSYKVCDLCGEIFLPHSGDTAYDKLEVYNSKSKLNGIRADICPMCRSKITDFLTTLVKTHKPTEEELSKIRDRIAYQRINLTKENNSDD